MDAKKMRVITGTARGKRLLTLNGMDVRPTPERVKEALFNIIQFEVEDRRMLDLFAGSGQIGIEALSRGAKEVVFVDASRQAVEIVGKNLRETGLQDRGIVRNMDSIAFLTQSIGKFDLAFLDPPYLTGTLQRALPLVVQIMNAGGTIICEHPSTEELPLQVGDFVQVRSYRYGKILLTLYRHKDVMGR